MTGFVVCPVCQQLLLSEEIADHEDGHRRMRLVAAGVAPRPRRGRFAGLKAVRWLAGHARPGCRRAV